MGGIAGIFGLGGEESGTGVKGPQSVQLMNPTNMDQINRAYDSTQGAMSEQARLLQALQAQQGIQNQSQVYGQMQDVAAGRGPNPALAQLNQQTAANVANQGALMAGQRGAGANVGLLARQAAQQGAATQQQAVGQAATLQAQQSLNALNSAGNIAGSQVANQMGQTNANVGSQQANQAAFLNAMASYNNANVGMQSNVNSVNGQLANTQLQGQQGILGGIMNGVGGIVGGLFAEGGTATNPGTETVKQGPQSSFAQMLASGYAAGGEVLVQAPTGTSVPSFGGNSGAEALKKGAESFFKGKDKKEKPKGEVTAGEPIQGDVMYAARGGVANYRGGGKVKANSPAQKAVAPGDNYANDKIDATLSEGEIVLPRSVTLGPNPVRDAAAFVAQEIAKRKVRK